MRKAARFHSVPAETDRNMKKSSFISGIIFGLVFLALGVFLFTLRGENTIILIIAIADLAFGLLLLLGGIIGSRKNPAAADIADNAGDLSYSRSYAGPRRDYPDSGSSYNSTVRSAPSGNEQRGRSDYHASENSFMDIDFNTMDADQIKAEERRLRSESRRISQEARDAVEDAKAAVERANQAERELAQAEAASRQLTGAAQQNALRDIDRLGQEAMHYSQAAAEAKQKARSLRNKSQQIALLHSQAVEAAASFMDDDF